jgi:hypothetical protein
MSGFHQVIEAQLDGATVRAAHMALFDFKTEPKRLWPGFGDLLLPSGLRFEGIGSLGTLSSISAGPGGAVEEITASLFGDETILARIEDDAEESVGRELTVYLQFFDIRKTDEAGNWVEWAPLDEPLTMFVGRMGPLKVKREPPGDGSSASRIVSVSAQNILVNRARPSFSFFSDRDQKARGDGTDNIFLRVSQYSEGTVRWPIF